MHPAGARQHRNDRKRFYPHAPRMDVGRRSHRVELPESGCTPADALAGADRMQPTADATADASEDWADMFPVPEGYTLKMYPPLSEERITELARMFGTARDRTA